MDHHITKRLCNYLFTFTWVVVLLKYSLSYLGSFVAGSYADVTWNFGEKCDLKEISNLCKQFYTHRTGNCKCIPCGRPILVSNWLRSEPSGLSLSIRSHQISTFPPHSIELLSLPHGTSAYFHGAGFSIFSTENGSQSVKWLFANRVQPSAFCNNVPPIKSTLTNNWLPAW